MMSLSRRRLLRGLATLPLLAAAPRTFPAQAQLQSARAAPISAEERVARVGKLQRLMLENSIAAVLVEPGSTLDYFTGIRWHRSERITLAVIPARGDTCVITPAFEEPSIRETLQIHGDVRPWNEDESPIELVIEALRERNILGGTLAAESTLRFFIVDGIRKASAAYTIVSADSLVGACRLIKSPAELALMQVANEITLKALRLVHGLVRPGMTEAKIGDLMDRATISLGGQPEFSLVLLNEASAYPHGSLQKQTVREGSVILMDCGCTVHGYQSDMSRTWVYGRPTARQRKIWNTVRHGQQIALDTAKIGVPAGSIDDAVRAYYEGEGWGPGYKLPGLPHRTGHGIGLDGHESAYLVHGDATPLAAGMCFSDEPGLYLPGEFGVRLEDCWRMTDAGARPFTQLAASLDDPI